MAISDSKPDHSASPPDSPDAPREVLLTTLADQVRAIDDLIALAITRIQVFDRDLSDHGWHRDDRVECLAHFLRSGPARRLDIIVHDTRWIEASAPRLLNLLRQYLHAMQIWRTGNEARSAMDPLVIVDSRHFLHRFHVDQPRAALAVSQPVGAKPLVARFEEIWATGEPGITGTVLGL